MVSVSAASAAIRGSIAALFFLFLIIVLTREVQVDAQNPAIDGEEQLMIKTINDYRVQKGLNRLKISVALTRVADWMSADMSRKNYFSHVDSQGRDPFIRMTAFGYKYSGTRGENLAAGYSDAIRTFNQWKNSPEHNANMLNPRFNVIGISRVYGGTSRLKWYWTTDFGSFVDTTYNDNLTSGKS